MTDNYKIWFPQHDGHAPPNWKEGMKWAIDRAHREQGVSPAWVQSVRYYVEPEALNSPNDDAMNELARWGWGYSFTALVYVLRQMSPDVLAKHGITLAPEKDWATELWAEAKNLYFKGSTNEEVVDLLRTRFEQMKKGKS